MGPANQPNQKTSESCFELKGNPNGPIQRSSNQTQDLGVPAHLQKQPPISQNEISAPRTTGQIKWDECMRQSVIAIVSTTVTATALGLMLPAAETLLLVGTGAGVLWSVKRCRTILRDGVLSPEEAKALDNRKKMERDKKKQQKHMENEVKQNKAANKDLAYKQNKMGAQEGNAGDCCSRLDKIQAERRMNRVEQNTKQKCTKLTSQSVNFPHENAIILTKPLLDEPVEHLVEQDPKPDNMVQSDQHETTTEVIDDENVKLTRVVGNTPDARHSMPLNGTSSVRIFAPFSRYLSETVVLTCDKQECGCNPVRRDCTCDSGQPMFEELRQYTLATDADVDESTRENSENHVIHRTSLIGNDGGDHKIEIPLQSSSPMNTHVSNHGLHLEEECQADVDERDDQNKLEVTLQPITNKFQSASDLTREDGDNTDSNGNGLANNKQQQDRKEIEVASSETIKNESWPFSFSLPTLDKFSQKKTNSFKWPPLTSSIIVKPKKEPPGGCSTSPQDSGRNHQQPKETDCNKD